MPMEYRELGRSGLRVAPLVFGGNVLGWTADQARSFSLLDAFVGSGFNLIDSADMYSRWVSGKRERWLIVTKVGQDMGGDRVGLSRRRIRQAVEDSLRRLQADCIDLYQAHDDDSATPLAETQALSTSEGES